MDGKPHPAWLAATLALLLAAPPGARAEEKAPGEDVVLRAMKDEMARSQERLRLGDMEKPYYLAYTAESGTVFAAGAVLGATSGGGEGPVRSLEAEARVGDYALDSSTGYSSGGGADPGLEDDYDAVRFQLWQATDEQYKAALEGLTRKQAALKARQVKDRPDDFSREDPVAWSDPAVSLTVDRARWTEAVRKV
ncbi:MAG: TldD/PmbA family protein, partial [Planctomycetes bacterium]|nr:TldD/PmbA family protein [Planctomycetota bacterium]